MMICQAAEQAAPPSLTLPGKGGGNTPAAARRLLRNQSDEL
jgi:hypothetical protein